MTRALRSSLPLLLAYLASACATGASAAHAQRPAQRGAALDSALAAAFAFRPIGPANMSGRVTAIAVADGSRGRTAYVGFASGGVWKTANAGVTWRPVFDEQAFASIGDVAVAPSDPDVVWVGTGERNSLRSNGWGDGVYRSTDGGRTWTHAGLTDTRETGRILIHPTDPQTVWVAALGHLWGANAERGLYMTTDGGASWRRVLAVDDTAGFIDVKMHPTDPQVLYAASWHRLRWGGGHMQGAGDGSGIWKSEDGGRSWRRLTNGLPTERVGRIGLGVTRARPDRVYASVQVADDGRRSDISPRGGLFRSDDAGESWVRVNDASPIPDYYYNEVWPDPNDADRLYYANIWLFESDDGGETLARMDLGAVHVDHHAMWIDPLDSEHIILGNDGGIYVTWDRGENWFHQTLPTGQFYETMIDSTRQPYHVCGGTQDNGTWCGPSRTREELGITNHDWYHVYGGDGFHSAVAPDSPHVRYAEYQFAGFARHDVEEWSYETLRPDAEDAGVESGFAFRWDWNTPFVLSRHDPTVLYLGANHLFRLTQRGDAWEILGPDMTRGNRFAPEPDTGHTSYRSLHSIAESALDARVLWTGSNDGLLWVSADGGASWRNVTERIPDRQARRCFVAEIEASRHDARRAYVAYDCHRRDDYRPYVYATDDAGRSWRRISDGLPQDAGSWVVREDPSNPDLLFVGNERGVWASIDRGRSWTRLRNGIPTVAVRDMDIHGGEKDLVVGTFGRSFYILDIAPLEELTPAVLAQPMHLFQPQDARQYNRRDTYASHGDAFFTAPNPAYGAHIYYYLRADEGKDVRLTIRQLADAPGPRTEQGEPPEPDEDVPEMDDPELLGRAQQDTAAADTARPPSVVRTITASGRPGVHRVVWDLTSERPRPRELGGPASRDELREVPAGVYEVELKAGGEMMTRRLVVRRGWPEASGGRIR